MKSTASTDFRVVLVLFIIGLLVRLYHLAFPSLWYDEICTTLRINHPLLGTVCLLKDSQYPPLYYAILNWWVGAVGNGEWALRFPSVIFSSLTIIVIYKLGKELFSKDAGLIAAVLLSFSVFAINYAQEAKMYSLFWFLAAGSFLYFFRFLKDQGKSNYRWYIITSILCCYTMYTGFLFLLAQSMIFLLMGEKKERGKWFTAQLIVVFSCVPWVIYVIHSFCSHRPDWYSSKPIVPTDYLMFSLKAFQFITGSSRDSWGRVNCFLYVFLIMYSLVDVLIISYKNKKATLPLLTNYYCLFIWLIIPVFVYFMFDRFVIPVDLSYRYVGFLQVPLILLVSSQINSFHGLIKKILLLVMVVISMINMYLYFEYNLKYPGEDWRKTAQELAQDLGANDIVLSLLPINLFKYYYKADTHQFIEVSEKDFSSGFLMNKGLLPKDVRSVFILYRKQSAPEIKLNGFFLDFKVLNGGIGFLHFQRKQSRGNFR